MITLKTAPQFRLPKQLDEIAQSLVDEGLFPTKQSFVTVAAGKLAMEYGYCRCKRTEMES